MSNSQEYQQIQSNEAQDLRQPTQPVRADQSIIPISKQKAIVVMIFTMVLYLLLNMSLIIMAIAALDKDHQCYTWNNYHKADDIKSDLEA